MADYGSFPTLINSTLITLGVAFVAYNQFRSNQNSTTRDTVQILKDNIAAKDIELAQMRANHDTALAQMKADHDTAIAEMRSNITTLTAQLETLKQANAVLQTTVSGRDILATIVEVLKPIPTLFLPGGFIEQVSVNQEKTLKDLSDILKAMEESKTFKSPDTRSFKTRKPSHLQPVKP